MKVYVVTLHRWYDYEGTESSVFGIFTNEKLAEEYIELHKDMKVTDKYFSVSFLVEIHEVLDGITE